MATTPTDTLTLYEKSRTSTREGLRNSVNTFQAEGEFNELARKLSRQSEREPGSHPPATQGKDIEKGVSPDEAFDLREYLTSSNDANHAAGIKHKHVRNGLLCCPI